MFASDPHTQMVNIICAIDPWCEIYVAKVAGADRELHQQVTKVTLSLFPHSQRHLHHMVL